MGDLGSSRTNKQESTIRNNQNAQQGSGNFANSGDFINSGTGSISVSVVSADKDIALEAIKVAGESSNDVALVALGAERLGSNALDVAREATNGSHQTVTEVLGAFQAYQHQTNDLIEKAVGTAEQIALNAAPVSPGSYAEATAGNNKQLLIFGGIGLAAVIVLLTNKHK